MDIAYIYYVPVCMLYFVIYKNIYILYKMCNVLVNIICVLF
jgi:hypothetical protein